MADIIITSEQMEVIQEYLDGKIGMFNATEHQMEVMKQVIHDAEALLEEQNAYDELAAMPGWDLVRWYLSKAGK